MHFRKPLFFILVLLSSVKVMSQSELEKANQIFEDRHAVIQKNKASSEKIDQVISLFKRSNQEPARTIGLLKSYEFKASWTEVSEKEKKELYEKAIELAKSQAEQFPDNGAIAYWHVANYARWADLIDITEAAQEGVIDEIKELAEKAIALDETYNQGGALRLLGGIHLEAPNIPLILTWPSNDKAKQLLKKAYQIAPQHPANVYLYAKALHITGKERDSRKIFKDLIDREERKNYFLVDQKYIGKGIKYYEENF